MSTKGQREKGSCDCPLNKTALIVVEEKSGSQHRVTVFDKELDAIIESVPGKSVVEKLLTAPNVKLSVNTKDVAFSAAQVL